MQLEVSNDYGYVIALGCFMYLTQQLILLIVPGGVMSARKDTGIKEGNCKGQEGKGGNATEPECSPVYRLYK